MNRDQIIERLNHFQNREAHSLSRYVLEAEPYVAPDETFAVKELQDVAAREHRRAEGLRRVMAGQFNAAASDRRYPAIVADMNYLALSYLLALIVRDKSMLIQEYDHFLALTGGAGEWAAVREAVAHSADEARYDLEHLRSLQSRLIAARENGKKPAKPEAADAPTTNT